MYVGPKIIVRAYITLNWYNITGKRLLSATVSLSVATVWFYQQNAGKQNAVELLCLSPLELGLD